jgi:acyl-CoA thioester hydrolase
MLKEFETQVRVRYDEADAMGYVHHANYFRYFELGRTEMLRASGGSYRDMESSGLLIVVVNAQVRFRRPARYDDLLTVRTRVSEVRHAKIEHEYEILRGADRLTDASLTLAVIDRQGRVQKVPDWLRA